MEKSWGHRIARLIGPPKPEACQMRSCEGFRTIWIRACSAPKCPSRMEYLIEWDYVAGRRRLAASQRRLYCREHAMKFCDKHGIEITDAPEIAYSDYEKAERSTFATAAS